MTTANDIMALLYENRAWNKERKIITFNGKHIPVNQDIGNMRELDLLQVGHDTWQFMDNRWVELVPFKRDTQYSMKLTDEAEFPNRPLDLRCRTSGSDNMLLVGVDGYGEKTAVDGGGWPILVEHYMGELRVLIWSDINEEDPTHTISLEGAKESERNSEEPE